MRKRFPQNSPWIMANLTFKTSNRLVITTSTRIFISPLLCSIMYFSYHFAVSFVCMNVNQIRSSNKKLIKRLRKELGQFWHGNRSSYKSMRDIYFLMMINVCMLYLYILNIISHSATTWFIIAEREKFYLSKIWNILHSVGRSFMKCIRLINI